MIKQKILDELKEYTELSNDESGEVCNCLLQLDGYRDYLGEPFLDALDKEIQQQLQSYKDCFEIEEVTETQTITYKQLNYIGC